MAIPTCRSLVISSIRMFSTIRASTVQQMRFGSLFTKNVQPISKLHIQPPTCVGLHQMQRTNFKGGHSKACGCCSYHTQGDKQLVEFLTEEITLEKKNQQKLPSFNGFEVNTQDAEVVLTKSIDGETVKVRFNVNHTVETELPPDAEASEDETQMVSRPPFSVEIVRDGSKTLMINCSYPPPEDMEEQAEAELDEFDIEEIMLYDNEVVDSTYAVSAATMDGNLYDFLMTMLDERGVNNEFAQQIIDFSTNYEQNIYVHFLENLKSFISK